MRRSLLLFTFASLSLATASVPAAAETPSYAAAIADSRRPAADTERDAARLPEQVLEFTQVKPGDVVGDYLMGGGYWTRMLAAEVGQSGKVYGFTADEFVNFRPAYADEQDAVVKDYDNVVKVRSPIAAPAFSEPLDMLLTVQNFHDLFITQMPEGTGSRAIKAFYDALKPGGTLVVIDHSAPDGSGIGKTSELHRIDRQFVIDALTAAGFALDGSADFYARPDDPRDANVFSPAIRGKTDQFALRFKKPG
ncbi:methyltransferase [Altererythrobacter salegens]|uniref:Methyltransferase n=1 Tax=Croceibacterium salegens TaxID=1737568 RepID=A0A6I4T0P9_9SPHN|nr:methyltransferase [Croceibacterium salegens]MXO61148.1 methyltransferase [Croceibacterium salegens]